MATNTFHLILRVGASLAAAALIALSSFLAERRRCLRAGSRRHHGGADRRRRTDGDAASTARCACRRVCRAGRAPCRSSCTTAINVVTPSTPAITRRLTVDPAVFARQMRWLNATATTRSRSASSSTRSCAAGRFPAADPDHLRRRLSRHVHQGLACPARLGMSATAYVISGRISKGPSFLCWRQLPRLETRGVEIGSHTVSHRALTDPSDSEALAELVRSRRMLERRLGHRVPWLAYPIGAYDARIERLARRAGYVLAVTTQAGTSPVRPAASRPASAPHPRHDRRPRPRRDARPVATRRSNDPPLRSGSLPHGEAERSGAAALSYVPSRTLRSCTACQPRCRTCT